MAVVLPISQKMDNVIYFSKNENNLLKYRAKCNRENGSIIWYNQIIKQVQHFESINQWMDFLEKKLSDEILTEFESKLDSDWEMLKMDFDEEPINKIDENEPDNLITNLFHQLHSLGF